MTTAEEARKLAEDIAAGNRGKLRMMNLQVDLMAALQKAGLAAEGEDALGLAAGMHGAATALRCMADEYDKVAFEIEEEEKLHG
jgi:hypothetical protein